MFMKVTVISRFMKVTVISRFIIKLAETITKAQKSKPLFYYEVIYYK